MGNVLDVDGPGSAADARFSTPVKTTIKVDGRVLRQLLSDDALVQLEEMAHEKVAEQITRKLLAGRVDETIKAALEKVQQDVLETYTSQWRFPREAQAFIRSQIRTEIDAAFADAKRDVRVTASEAFAEMLKLKESQITSQIAKELVAAKEEMERLFTRQHEVLMIDVRAQARAEFLDVLKEAKAAGL